MTFEEAWVFTDTIPGSFTKKNAQELYACAMLVPKGGNIVEVGVDQGRSASLILQAVQDTAHVYLIDSWESVLGENVAKIRAMKTALLAMRQKPTFQLLHMSSTIAAASFRGQIDLIHIDANHYAPHPAEDCEAWLPKVRSGGIACFHDYGPASSFPAVTEAVDKYTAGWEDLGEWESLAIRRKA